MQRQAGNNTLKATVVKVLGILFLASPAIVAADSIVPIGPTPEQLLARSAAISAASTGVNGACLVQTRKIAVRVNEPFSLWWGSYGAEVGSGWNPTGAYSIVVGKPGAYEYKFTFLGALGSSSTCRTTVSVS